MPRFALLVVSCTVLCTLLCSCSDPADPPPDASRDTSIPSDTSIADDSGPLEGSCTDGVDCLCDRLSGYLFCEDFDDLALDDGLGNAFYEAGYVPGDSFSCPTGPDSEPATSDEGTEDDDCYNLVQNDSCDVAGETDCARGNQSLGQKYDATYVHGLFGSKSFPASESTFGITQLIKYAANFHVGNGLHKHTQWNGTGEHTLLGQNGYFQPDGDNHCVYSGSDWLDERSDDMIFARQLFMLSAPDVRSATCTLGRVFVSDEPRVNWAPAGSDFPGGEFTWPLGQWACIRMKFTNFGQNDAGVEMWWASQTQPAETKVLDISGIDLTSLLGDPSVSQIRFDNYFNGNNGVDDGYCTGDGGASLGCERSYRYHDNIVITNGDPVTCADIGF